MSRKLSVALRNLIPKSSRRFLTRLTRRPPIGQVDFHNLRRLTPISRAWGADRGLPLDRYYIELFLKGCSTDIFGRVMEIGDSVYTRQFGSGKVAQIDVLDVDKGNPKATLIADLSAAPQIPSNSFDCVICTQTLQLIPDVGAAVRTLHRILRPGGTLLATASTISQLEMRENNVSSEHWRFTSHGFAWLLQQSFDAANLRVVPYGNVLTAIAFLHGLSTGELQQPELDYADPAYEMVVAARAVKRVAQP